MSIQKYRAFLAAVENQSLTKTANTLGYTQPGISHMLSSLERELGFPLIIRTKDGIFPTENARELLSYMKQAVALEDTIQTIARNICGLESGILRIGSFRSMSYRWLPSIISAFLNRHADIELQIFEGTHGELSDWLLNNAIDIAFMSSPTLEAYDFIPLAKDPIVAVISKEHPLSEAEEINPKDLSHYPFIIPNEGADETVWTVMNAEGLVPNVKFRIKGDMITLEMVRQGLGVSLIPKLTLPDRQDMVAAKPLIGNYYRTLGICIRSAKYVSPAQREFIALAKQFVESNRNG